MTHVDPAPRTRRPLRAGFTLLELIIVVIIIAALAGLVIPQVAMMGRSTDMAASAKTQGDLSNNLGTYFVLQKRWPTGMDSLLIDDDQDGTPEGVHTPLDTNGDGNQDTGLPDSGPHLDRSLVMLNLADPANAGTTGKDGFDPMASSPDRTGFSRSFTRGGFDFVYDHDTTVENANNSATFTAPRTLDRTIGGAGCWVAVVDEADWDGDGNDGTGLISRVMPNGVVDPDTILVAVAVGRNIDARSKTLSNPPIYPGNDGSYYGRYVAIFKVYANGERPTLVTVVDAYGRNPDYTQQQFNESLADDARRG